MSYFFHEIRRLFTYNLKFTYVLDDDDYEDEETAEDDQSEETDNTMFERECDLYEISSAVNNFSQLMIRKSKITKFIEKTTNPNKNSQIRGDSCPLTSFLVWNF